MPKHARYDLVEETNEYVVIRDLGPWHVYPTVTNDAEHVVAQLPSILNGRKLEYIDSDGHRDSLLVKDGKFAGFQINDDND